MSNAQDITCNVLIWSHKTLNALLFAFKSVSCPKGHWVGFDAKNSL